MPGIFFERYGVLLHVDEFPVQVVGGRVLAVLLGCGREVVEFVADLDQPVVIGRDEGFAVEGAVAPREKFALLLPAELLDFPGRWRLLVDVLFQLSVLLFRNDRLDDVVALAFYVLLEIVECRYLILGQRDKALFMVGVLDLEHAVGGRAVPYQHNRPDYEICPLQRAPDLCDRSVVAIILHVEPVFLHQVGLLLFLFADAVELAFVFQFVVGFVPDFTLFVLLPEFVEVHAGQRFIVGYEQPADVVYHVEPVVLGYDARHFALVHEIHEVGRVLGQGFVIGVPFVFEIFVGVFGFTVG